MPPFGSRIGTIRWRIEVTRHVRDRIFVLGVIIIKFIRLIEKSWLLWKLFRLIFILGCLWRFHMIMWKKMVSYWVCIISNYNSLFNCYAWIRLMDGFQFLIYCANFIEVWCILIIGWLIGENPWRKVMFGMFYTFIKAFKVVRPQKNAEILMKAPKNQGWNWVSREFRLDRHQVSVKRKPIWNSVPMTDQRK